jgi:hypothetical protein
MKIISAFLIPLGMLLVNTTLGQPVPTLPQRALAVPGASKPGEPLTRFDLDFPGGTPKELVAAIQKAMGRPLNAIVSDEHAKLRLPALNMKNVNVAELFQALEMASRRQEIIPAAGSGAFGSGFGYAPGTPYTTVSTAYGFRSGNGPVTDDTIWNFFVEKPSPAGQPPPKYCRFYSLAPYLERGSSVDDITTAIETGAKMYGNPFRSEDLVFHKDTKLLIAVGEQAKLEIIDSVLRALDSQKPTPKPGRPPAPEEKAAEQSKPKEKPKSDKE